MSHDSADSVAVHVIRDRKSTHVMIIIGFRSHTGLDDADEQELKRATEAWLSELLPGWLR